MSSPVRSRWITTATVLLLLGGMAVPPVQLEAWYWKSKHRRDDGPLPTCGEIAAVFSRNQRRGRLVKQRGLQGVFERTVA